jgi:catechol 2,3-dioxygenase-like lactoylglutathione lyase family enzyme
LTIFDLSGRLTASTIINAMVGSQEEPMSRVQLALNVGDLDASIEFYTKLFRTPPAKVRENYANFAIAEPPLKLVLIAGQGEPGTLNHVGVEVESTDEVAAAATRMQAEGAECDVQEATTCCFAVQDKVWTADPDGAPWEVYTVLADADVMLPPDSTCCAPAGQQEMCCAPSAS